jgi:hypothetical protein
VSSVAAADGGPADAFCQDMIAALLLLSSWAFSGVDGVEAGWAKEEVYREPQSGLCLPVAPGGTVHKASSRPHDSHGYAQVAEFQPGRVLYDPHGRSGSGLLSRYSTQRPDDRLSYGHTRQLHGSKKSRSGSKRSEMDKERPPPLLVPLLPYGLSNQVRSIRSSTPPLLRR